MWTVYKHTTPSNKVYIGITNRDPHIRWANGSGYRNNSHFWSAICKYGWDNIKHEILYTNLTEEEACNLERLLIAEYDSTDHNKGYNREFGGNVAPLHCEETRRKIGQAGLGRTPWNKGLTGEKSHSYGKKLSEDTRRKIGEASRGRAHSFEAKEKNRQAHLGKHYRTAEGIARQVENLSVPVVQFTKDGQYVNTYSSAKEASRQTGIAFQHICSCRIGKRKSAGGYIWRYATDQQETG